MDGAPPASAATAQTKAVAAATMRQATGPAPANGEPDMLLSLSLQNAAAVGGAKMTSLKGGVPIVVDGQVIGPWASATGPASKAPRLPAPEFRCC